MLHVSEFHGIGPTAKREVIVTGLDMCKQTLEFMNANFGKPAPSTTGPHARRRTAHSSQSNPEVCRRRKHILNRTEFDAMLADPLIEKSSWQCDSGAVRRRPPDPFLHGRRQSHTTRDWLAGGQH